MSGSSRWKRQLGDLNSIVEELISKREAGEGSLRFGRHLVSASDIAEQFFCERKVEMQYLHGQVETEQKSLGVEAHENLLADAVKIKRELLWQKIYQSAPVHALEFNLLTRRNQIILVGRPDSVLFRSGIPLVVFEYKFSKSGRTYKTHHVQAMTYGILLNNMGFDTSQLLYALVIAQPEARNDRQLKQNVMNAITENGLREARLTLNNARIQLHKFNQAEAERDLDWAIEFWKKSREAIPTRNPRKCGTCEYAEKCEITSPHAES